MRHYLLPVLLLFAVSVLTPLFAQDDADAIAARLVEDGYENVRVVRHNDQIEVVLEDNHNRSIPRGLAHALQLISPSSDCNESVRLIALENRMPKLTVEATHHSGTWALSTTHGGKINQDLKAVKPQNSSAFKFDFVAYPNVFFSNSTMDRLWNTSVYFSPALMMDLWRGGSLVFQYNFFLWENFKHRYVPKLSPNYVSIQQQILSNHYFDLTATAGLFGLSRCGIDLRGKYHVTDALDLGFEFNYTGPWYVGKNDGFNMCKWDKMSYYGIANYYERHTNLELELKVGQFYLEHKGFRADISRHFCDHVIFAFLEMTDKEKNFGCGLNFPIGPKKMGKHRRVRLRLPKTSSVRFVENLDWRNYNYTQEDLGQIIKIRPDDNYSEHYWNPDFMEEMIQIFLEDKD